MNSSQVAVVTGANQGIGFEIAKALHAEGITVLIGARAPLRGQSAAREIGANAVPLQLDVTDPTSIAAAAGRVRSGFGRPHILVQNAAIALQDEVRGICVSSDQTVLTIIHDVDEALDLDDKIVLMTDEPGAKAIRIVRNTALRDRVWNELHCLPGYDELSNHHDGFSHVERAMRPSGRARAAPWI